MAQFLSREEIQEYFIDQLPVTERTLYQQFGNLGLYRVFNGKLFVIYTLTPNKTVPTIISNLRVTAINIVEDNLTVSVLDLKTGKSCQVSYLPELLCGYDVFATIPSECMVMKVVKKNDDGSTFDAGLTAGLLLKHRMKPEFKKAGYVYCLGLSEFRRLFGEDADMAFEQLEMMSL
jgi:arginine repressor